MKVQFSLVRIYELKLKLIYLHKLNPNGAHVMHCVGKHIRYPIYKIAFMIVSKVDGIRRKPNLMERG